MLPVWKDEATYRHDQSQLAITTSYFRELIDAVFAAEGDSDGMYAAAERAQKQYESLDPLEEGLRRLLGHPFTGPSVNLRMAAEAVIHAIRRDKDRVTLLAACFALEAVLQEPRDDIRPR